MALKTVSTIAAECRSKASSEVSAFIEENAERIKAFVLKQI